MNLLLVIGYIVMLVYEIGILGLVCPCVVIMQFLIQKFSGDVIRNKQSEMRIKTQDRNQKLDEMITGIKTIKFNLWENLFDSKVKQIRKEETRIFLLLEIIRTMSIYICMIVAKSNSLIIFWLHFMFKGELGVS